MPARLSERIRRRWLLVAAAGLVALLLGALAAVLLLRDAEQPADAGSLLAIALPDLDGREQPLAQWRGKVLVVNFWATWCAPCREEMPMFVKLQAEHGARGLQFVGIAVDEAPKVRQFATEIGLNYPSLIGGFGAMELSRTFGNRVMALPFTVIIGRDGRIVMTQLGPVKPQQLEAALREFL